MIPEDGDSSGIFLHYTRHPQPKTAGVLLLGTSGFAPKHSTTYFETACRLDDDREIHPFAFRTHTHALGKLLFSATKYTNGLTILGIKSTRF